MKHIYDKKEFIDALKELQKEIEKGEKSYYNDRYSIVFDGMFYSINNFKETAKEMLSFQLGKDNIYQIIRNLKHSELHLANKKEFTQEIANTLEKLEPKDNIVFNDIITWFKFF